MIFAIASPEARDIGSVAALRLAEEWRRRRRRVQLVVSESLSATLPDRFDCTSKSAAEGTTLRLADDLEKISGTTDRTIVESPPGTPKLQRAALSVADAALLLCRPDVSGSWPSGRVVEMARKAGKIRDELHVGLVITRSARDDTEDRRTGDKRAPADVPIFDSVLDFSGDTDSPTGAGDRIRRAPTAAPIDGIDSLVDELEDLRRRSPAKPKPASRRDYRRPR